MYIDKEYTELRFGDIVKGYPSFIPVINTPFLEKLIDHSIDIKIQNYLVIIDPCCAIEKGSLSLTQLIPIEPNMIDTPYFRENLLRINDLQPPFYCVHPIVWNKYSDSEKLEVLSDNQRYPYSNYFIYEAKGELPEYPIKRYVKFTLKKAKTDISNYEQEKVVEEIPIKYYMINFKHIFHILCPKIKNIRESPLDSEIKRSKIFELTIPARKQLRDKLASFFGTNPLEDAE